MDVTAIRLCEEIAGTQFAYVQSDEISLLVADFHSIDTQPWFDGGLQKWASVGASIATAAFNFEIANLYFASVYGQESIGEHPLLGKKKPLATFDFRAFPLPDFVEVENYFVWRQNDAVRNSVTMLAQHYASHKQLMGKKRSDQHDIIHAAGDNWAKHPNGFKNGRVVRYKSFSEVVHATKGLPATEKVKALKERTSNWFVDIATPVFTQDRKYLRDMIPIAWEDDVVVRKH
jgi:tRNA(His) guanylyltransferase